MSGLHNFPEQFAGNSIYLCSKCKNSLRTQGAHKCYTFLLEGKKESNTIELKFPHLPFHKKIVHEQSDRTRQKLLFFLLHMNNSIVTTHN